MSHTAEPWSLLIEKGDFNIKASTGFYVAVAVPFPGFEEENVGDNARRIIACVNACAGIETGALEQHGAFVGSQFKELGDDRDEWKKRYEFSITQRDSLTKQRDELAKLASYAFTDADHLATSAMELMKSINRIAEVQEWIDDGSSNSDEENAEAMQTACDAAGEFTSAVRSSIYEYQKRVTRYRDATKGA